MTLRLSDTLCDRVHIVFFPGSNIISTFVIGSLHHEEDDDLSEHSISSKSVNRFSLDLSSRPLDQDSSDLSLPWKKNSSNSSHRVSRFLDSV